jgi:hypothetical protein
MNSQPAPRPDADVPSLVALGQDRPMSRWSTPMKAQASRVIIRQAR